MITSTYIQGTSLLHKADPRIKTILLLFFVVLFFLPLSIPVLIVIFSFILLGGIKTLGLTRILQPVKMILPIIIFVIILTPPFFKDGDILLTIKGINILTTGGAFQTLRLISRFTGITLCFYIFFSTTSIDYFILTLLWFKLPYKAALVLTIALRYIPSMVIVFNTIKDAHHLRSGKDNKKYFWNKLTTLFPTLVSVLIHSIKSIPALAMTLELKGIGSTVKRSQFKYIKSNKLILQIIFTTAIVISTIVVVIFL